MSDTGSQPTYSLEMARGAYLGLADELTNMSTLSVDQLVESDWDADWLRAAKGYAALRGLPFPPPDIDRAIDAVREAERRAETGA